MFRSPPAPMDRPLIGRSRISPSWLFVAPVFLLGVALQHRSGAVEVSRPVGAPGRRSATRQARTWSPFKGPAPPIYRRRKAELDPHRSCRRGVASRRRARPAIRYSPGEDLEPFQRSCAADLSTTQG